MITAVESTVRRGAKLVAWVVLAIVGLVALLIVGWVPPELAAMLGSARGGRERGDRDPGSGAGPQESRSSS